MSQSNVNKVQFVNNSSEEGKEKVMRIPYVVKGNGYGVAIKEEDGVLTVVANGKSVKVLADRVQAVKELPTRRVNGMVYAVTKQGFISLQTGETKTEGEVMTPPVRDIPTPVEYMRPGKNTGGRRDNTPTPKHPSEMSDAELAAAGWRTRAPKA
jgi:hypothetical protein